MVVVERVYPEYRIGFSITSKDGAYYIWSIVTDLKTGKWQQDIRTVTGDVLDVNALEVLANVDKWIAANAGLDAKDEARKRLGLDFYWDYEYNDGFHEYVVDFGGGFCGSADGETGNFEGLLETPEEIIEFSGEDSVVLRKEIEVAYKSRVNVV